jgi:hypothetical protein
MQRNIAERVTRLPQKLAAYTTNKFKGGIEVKALGPLASRTGYIEIVITPQ